MERWRGKVAIVTGASSGIGAAIAEELVHHGCQVVGLARRKEKLEELSEKLRGASGKLYTIKTDITEENDILAAFEWVQNNLGPIHILINNAGISKSMMLMDSNTEDLKKILNTNVLGLTISTREAIKNMKENKVDGHIIHINSITGHYIIPIPNINIYPATKYAVTALAETLRQELNFVGSKIKITSISPGFVPTEIFSVGGFLEDETVKAIMKVQPRMEAKDVAGAVIYALGTPPYLQVSEITLRSVGEIL